MSVNPEDWDVDCAFPDFKEDPEGGKMGLGLA